MGTKLSRKAGERVDELADKVNENLHEDGSVKDGCGDSLKTAVDEYEELLARKVGGATARFDTLQKAVPAVAEMLRAAAARPAARPARSRGTTRGRARPSPPRPRSLIMITITIMTTRTTRLGRTDRARAGVVDRVTRRKRWQTPARTCYDGASDATPSNCFGVPAAARQHGTTP